MLPKDNRLTSRTDFQLLFKQGKRYQGENFSGFIMEADSTNPLFGFVVSNKISKSAVIRNQIRRYFRESVRLLLPKIKTNIKVVLVSKGQAQTADFKQIDREIKKFLSESNLLNE